MLRRLKRFVRLSARERGLFVRACLWLTVADLALRLKLEGLTRWATIASAPGSKEADPEATQRARAYAQWLQAAARYYPTRAECLHRSIALQWWLAREGVSSRLRIGVRKDGADLAAHAWLEMDGTVINDQPAAVARFKPLMGRPQ